MDDEPVNMNMEVTFLLEDQSTLCIEVDFFESFKEIKEKIEKHTNIPVDKQTLIFNGQVLQNKTSIGETNIWGNIPIKLLVASDSFTHELHHNFEPPPIQEFDSIPMPPFPPPSINEFQEMTTPIGPTLDKFLNELDQMPETPQTFSETLPPPFIHTPVTPQTTSTAPPFPDDLDELMQLSHSETPPLMVDQMLLLEPLQTTSPAVPLPEDVPVINTPPPPPNISDFEEFEIDVDEFMALSPDMPMAPQTISPVEPIIVDVDTPSPQTVNEYLEDSEMFLESMMEVITPTQQEFQDLLQKCMDTQEKTSPAPLLPRLLNFDDMEVSPSPPQPPPPPERTRVELTVKIIQKRIKPFQIEMNLDDTVLQLKENIYKKKRRRIMAPSEMSVRLESEQELNDQLTLRDCGMLTISSVTVCKKSSLPTQPISPVAATDKSNSRSHLQRISPAPAAANSMSRLSPQLISPAAAAADSSISPAEGAASSMSRLPAQQISPPAAAGANSSMSQLPPQRISPVVAADSSMLRLPPKRISPMAASADSLKSRLHPTKFSPVAAADSSKSRLDPKRISPAADNLNSLLYPQSVVGAADPVWGAKMLNVVVVPKEGSERIPMQVNVFNKVETLRDELERFHKHLVPEKRRYFFILQKTGFVMTETYAFNWYRMEDGDVIQINPECGPPKPNRKSWPTPTTTSSSKQL